MTTAKCAVKSRKLAAHTFTYTQEVERRSRKWGQARNSQSLPPSDVLPPERLQPLMVPYPPQTIPPLGTKCSVHELISKQVSFKPKQASKLVC